jgi:hypothetical protein
MAEGLAGFFILLFVDFLAVIALLAAFPGSVLFIGLVQLIYVVPGCIYLWKKNKPFAQGVIIAAAIVFLLNSLCFGLISNF